MTELTIAGETFNILAEGDETNPVLMLSNSLGTNLHMWDAQIPALTKHFRTIRYDSRGHGRSIVSEGPYSIEQLGRDALAIMDALGIAKAHWLGLSKGGTVGQWLLIHAPERIERAVLANTAAQYGSPDGWNARIASVKQSGMRATVDFVLERWFSPSFLASQAARVEPVRQGLLTTAAEGYAACCSALRDADLREGLRQIEHPVLVVAGKDDPATAKPQTDFLAATIPHAKLVVLEARHISNIEDSAAFTKAAVEFLTAKSPARRPATGQTALPPPPRRPAGRRARGLIVEPLRPAAVVPDTKRSAKPATPAPAAKMVATKAKASAKPASSKSKPPAAPKRAKTAAAAKAPPKKTPAKKMMAKKAVIGKPAAPKTTKAAVAPKTKAAAKTIGKKPVKAVAKTLPKAATKPKPKVKPEPKIPAARIKAPARKAKRR